MTELTAIVGLIAFVALPLGCTQEEADKLTDPGSGTTDADTDPQLECMYEVLGDAQTLGRTLLNSTWFLMDTVVAMQPEADSSGQRRRRGGGGSSLATDSVLVEYHESSGYWLLYQRHSDDTGYFSMPMTIIDSLQLVGQEGPLQWPDKDQLLGIISGGYIIIVFGDADSVAATHDLTIEGDIGCGDAVTINGLRTFLIDNYRDGDSCDVYLDLTAVITDETSISQQTYGFECPLSGSVQYNGVIAVQCSGSNRVDFNDIWGITQTFLGGGMAEYYVLNTTDQWWFVGSCY